MPWSNIEKNTTYLWEFLHFLAKMYYKMSQLFLALMSWKKYSVCCTTFLNSLHDNERHWLACTEEVVIYII